MLFNGFQLSLHGKRLREMRSVRCQLSALRAKFRLLPKYDNQLLILQYFMHVLFLMLNKLCTELKQYFLLQCDSKLHLDWHLVPDLLSLCFSICAVTSARIMLLEHFHTKLPDVFLELFIMQRLPIWLLNQPLNKLLPANRKLQSLPN